MKINRERVLGGFQSGSNLFASSGTVEKPTWSYNNGNYQLTIDKGIYRVFLTQDFTGISVQFAVQQTILQLSANSKYYICAKYNNGNPIVYTETDINIANDSDILAIFTVFTDANGIDLLDWGTEAKSLANRINERLIDTDRYGIVGGFSLSANSLIITVGGGEFYLGSNKIAYSEINSTTNLCELLYKNETIGWTTQNVTTYPNTKYDNGSGTLQDLTVGQYGVVWVWKSAGNTQEMYIALGSQSYESLDLAKNDKIPSDLPEKLLLGSFLVGRLIFQKSSTSAIVESAFDTTFNASSASNHNSLLGLQQYNGVVGENYHVSLQQIINYEKTVNILSSLDECTVYQLGEGFQHSTTIINTYEKLNVPFTVEIKSDKFLSNGNSRLTYTGVRSKRFNLNGSASLLLSGTPNMTIHFIIVKNGVTQLVNTISASKLDGSTNIGSINVATSILLNQNNYIEIFAMCNKVNIFSVAHLNLQLTEDIGYSFTTY